MLRIKSRAIRLVFITIATLRAALKVCMFGVIPFAAIALYTSITNDFDLSSSSFIIGISNIIALYASIDNGIFFA